MHSDHKLDPKAEIGHVLLIGIVGSSKLLINGPRDQSSKQTLLGAERAGCADATGSFTANPLVNKTTRELLREEVARTIAIADDVDEELRHLSEILIAAA